jgi:hypothetical protein
MFLAALQRPQFLHDFALNHHNSTTKTPHQNRTSPKTPFKNTRKNNKNPPFEPRQKKSEKTGLGLQDGLEK